MALRLAGDDADDAHMRRTAAWIREQGGVEATRSFTRIWLSLNGWWSWDDLPAMPPEVMLLPRWWPLNIYDFACWARPDLRGAHHHPFPSAGAPRALPDRRAAHLPLAPDGLLAAKLGGLLQSSRPRAPLVRETAAGLAAGSGIEPRRGLDRAAAGARRFLGRHPAALGQLHPGAHAARLSAGSPRARARPGGVGHLHDRRRADAPVGSLPVTRLGHRAGDWGPDRCRTAGQPRPPWFKPPTGCWIRKSA